MTNKFAPTPTAANSPLPAICLGGPTGSGKTGLAIKLANSLGCEIVNADSRQVYSDFPIITAQPDAVERELAPHHLYGYLPSGKKTNAGEWSRLAAVKIREILAVGKIPLLTGGTGLYFHAILRGLAEIPDVPPEISFYFGDRIKSAGPEVLHGELAVIDPEYAARVHPHDRQRIQRALEVHAATGKTFSWWHKNGASPALCAGPFIFINAPLESLEAGFDARIGKMLDSGAMLEAAKAWEICPDARAPGWSGIGCRECLAYLQKNMSLPDCRRQWLAATRAYAKRQLTWFRGRPEAVGINMADFPQLARELEKWAKSAGF